MSVYNVGTVCTSRRPDVWTSNVQTSGCPEGHPDVLTSGRVGAWTSARPHGQSPDVRTSGHPDVRTSGRSDAQQDVDRSRVMEEDEDPLYIKVIDKISSIVTIWYMSGVQTAKDIDEYMDEIDKDSQDIILEEGGETELLEEA